MTLNLSQTDGQEAFAGMERTTLFTFTGMKYESFKTGFAIGEEVEFRVRGKIIGAGKEVVKDVEHDTAKVAVQLVTRVPWLEGVDDEPVAFLPAEHVLDADERTGN